jgi:subtilase family serine protease
MWLAACNANFESTPLSRADSIAPSAGVHRACPEVQPGFATCEVLVRDAAGPAINGYLAADLQAAYNLPSATRGSGQVVAVVEAFDNPNVASDLAAYRAYMGLPPANFTKYNQQGQQGNYPQGDVTFGIDIDLDLEMVSATCPNCTLLLVEASSNSWSDIGKSEDEAVKLGAGVISNSYIGLGATRSDYDHKHVTIVASGGDDGYHTGDPADFPSVVAVGGTHLTRGGGSRGWTESAWSDTGSGCSTQRKPKWQHDLGCTFRTTNDVSMVGDPLTGVAMYDTYGRGGWFEVGGTSASAPLAAGIFGLAENAAKQDGGKTFWLAEHQQYLNDVTTGSNGNCSPAYLCTAGPGYDGPTGWGTPNGIGAF